MCVCVCVYVCVVRVCRLRSHHGALELRSHHGTLDDACANLSHSGYRWMVCSPACPPASPPLVYSRPRTPSLARKAFNGFIDLQLEIFRVQYCMISSGERRGRVSGPRRATRLDRPAGAIIAAALLSVTLAFSLWRRAPEPIQTISIEREGGRTAKWQWVPSLGFYVNEINAGGWMGRRRDEGGGT